MSYKYKTLKKDADDNNNPKLAVYIALAALPYVPIHTSNSVRNRIVDIIVDIANLTLTQQNNLEKDALNELSLLMVQSGITVYGTNNTPVKYKGKSSEFGTLFDIGLSVSFIEYNANPTGFKQKTVDRDIFKMISHFDTKLTNRLNRTARDAISVGKYGRNNGIQDLSSAYLLNNNPSTGSSASNKIQNNSSTNSSVPHQNTGSSGSNKTQSNTLTGSSTSNLIPNKKASVPINSNTQNNQSTNTGTGLSIKPSKTNGSTSINQQGNQSSSAIKERVIQAQSDYNNIVDQNEMLSRKLKLMKYLKEKTGNTIDATIELGTKAMEFAVDIKNKMKNKLKF